MDKFSAYQLGQIAALQNVVKILIATSHPQIRDGIYADIKDLDPSTDFSEVASENKAYENGFSETIQKIQR